MSRSSASVERWTARDLLVGRERQEELDLIDPGGPGRRDVSVPARSLVQPVADQLGLAGGVIVHDERDVEVGGHVGLDLVEDLAFVRSPAPPLRGFGGFARSLHAGILRLGESGRLWLVVRWAVASEGSIGSCP